MNRKNCRLIRFQERSFAFAWDSISVRRLSSCFCSSGVRRNFIDGNREFLETIFRIGSALALARGVIISIDAAFSGLSIAIGYIAPMLALRIMFITGWSFLQSGWFTLASAILLSLRTPIDAIKELLGEDVHLPQRTARL